MSVGIIQDNLVKTSLVQQNQSRVDDIARGQELGQTAAQREDSRQADQVVLSSQSKEEHGVRTDEEREPDEPRKRKKRGDEDEDEESADSRRQREEQERKDKRPRARMRTNNVTV